jgi:DNA uptake protein ComE-like DNA-binding protein
LLGASGQDKLNLKTATPEEMQERFGVTAEQANALTGFAKGPSAKMEMLLTQDLSTLASGGGNSRTPSTGRAQTGRNSAPSNNAQLGQETGAQSGRSSSGAPQTGGTTRLQALDATQLRKIFQEGTLDAEGQPILGKVNLNTAPPSILRALLPSDPISADAILSLRSASSTGLLALSDLRTSNRISPDSLAAIAPYADTQSYVFTVTSRGRSATTGLEVEITAVIDRSTLPARILEYREQ